MGKKQKNKQTNNTFSDTTAFTKEDWYGKSRRQKSKNKKKSRKNHNSNKTSSAAQ